MPPKWMLGFKVLRMVGYDLFGEKWNWSRNSDMAYLSSVAGWRSWIWTLDQRFAVHPQPANSAWLPANRTAPYTRSGSSPSVPNTRSGDRRFSILLAANTPPHDRNSLENIGDVAKMQHDYQKTWTFSSTGQAWNPKKAGNPVTWTFWADTYCDGRLQHRSWTVYACLLPVNKLILTYYGIVRKPFIERTLSKCVRPSWRRIHIQDLPWAFSLGWFHRALSFADARTRVPFKVAWNSAWKAQHCHATKFLRGVNPEAVINAAAFCRTCIRERDIIQGSKSWQPSF